MQVKLLIISDDFTGALDTGVQFSHQGIETMVLAANRYPQSTPPNISVLVIDSESRHLCPAAAYDAVYKLVTQAMDEGVSYIYKKVDSGLRGNIGAELEALSKGGGQGVCFIPAFPEMDRYTVDGIHYIEGIPVADSVFGRDPFNPVKQSRVSDIIGEQSDMKVVDICKELPSQQVIGIKNISDREAMQAFAKSLSGGRVPRLMSGCAGFAAYLPDILNLQKPGLISLPATQEKLLILSGSVNPVGYAQQNYAREHGFSAIQLSADFKLTENAMSTPQGLRLIAEIQSGFQQAENGLIISAALDEGAARETDDIAAQRGLSMGELRQRISENLGSLGAAICKRLSGMIPFIIGGDTLYSTLLHLDVTTIFPKVELIPGIVWSQVAGHPDVQRIISKSGGFSEEDAYLRVLHVLRKS